MLKPCLLDTPKFFDNRGYTSDLTSFTSYNMEFKNFRPNQILICQSKQWVIRGLHCQLKVPQNKVVSVVDGEILDVVVNINVDSPDFGNIEYFRIESALSQSLFIPEGYLHGYQVLSGQATLCYQIDGVYDPDNSLSIYPHDPELGINWVNLSSAIMSKNDSQGLLFESLKRRLE